MGNAGSNARERRKSGDLCPPSPHKDSLSQAFVFDRKSDKLSAQESNDEDESYYSKDDETGLRRQQSTATSGASDNEENKLVPTVFKWEGGGKQVCISGTFSDWKPIPMVKSHGDFVTIVDLPEGEHQYKYCVDGEWKFDPTAKVVDNGIGSKNNVLSVNNTDFEVFEALDMDSKNSSQSNENDDYSQNIPTVIRPWEKVPGPPVLPPHLLQVILNKDTPLSCEPTLLPEPNHVMLNHLYALSIKDGVMVLSATHRYRKKYVTTLLYKPI